VRVKPVQHANKTQAASLEDAWLAFIMSLDWRSPVLQVDETALARTDEPAPPAVTMIKRAKPVPYANQTTITAPGDAHFFPNASLVRPQGTMQARHVSQEPIKVAAPPRRSKVNESRAATMPEPVLSVPSQEPQFLEPLITSEDSLRGPPSGRIEEVVAGPILPHDLSIETSATVITKSLSDLLELKCRLISHTTRRGLDDEIVLHCMAKV
jgi:hypothetical protein